MTGHKFTWRHVVRKILSLVFSRLVVTGVLLLVQIVWLLVLFYRLSDYAAWINGAGLTLSVLMCLALIRQDSTVPEFKISWLILFTVMPVHSALARLLQEYSRARSLQVTSAARELQFRISQL